MLNQEFKPFRGKNEWDDIFAFGTLLFELFSGKLPFANENEITIANKIRSGHLPNQLRHIDCTDKLKKLIHRCWNHVEEMRPRILYLVQFFHPGKVNHRFIFLKRMF